MGNVFGKIEGVGDRVCMNNKISWVPKVVKGDGGKDLEVGSDDRWDESILRWEQGFWVMVL
jgi:hypothetical protein